MALGKLNLENFFQEISQSREKLQETILDIEEIDIPTTLVAQKWVLDNLYRETKRAIKKQAETYSEIEKIKSKILEKKAKQLMLTPTKDKYKDEFNKKSCKKADELVISLRESNKLVRQEIYESITLSDLEEYLNEEYKNRGLQKLNSILQKSQSKLIDREKIFKFAGLMFELNTLKTDETWNMESLESAIINSLNGETLNLTSMICLINSFDFKGGYTSEPNLFAYKNNSKLEAIPLILDELNKIKLIFEFYGIDTTLTLFVGDTDYTEIGQYGPVNNDNLNNISKYIDNLNKYISRYGSDVLVFPISEITTNNPTYTKVKKQVLDNVTNMTNQDFVRKWYQRFENSVEKINESQDKKKLYPKDKLRAKSLEITRTLWAVNAAQGAVIAELGKNTVFISTETRERDLNYIIDSDVEKRFIPILYILNAAEEWNKKLTTKK